MKRFISLLLALALLCTPVCALGLEDLPGFSSGEFNSAELKAATADFIEHLDEFKESVKAMDDAELESFIRFTAEKYNIPEMNVEQIEFLMRLARGIETAEEVGDTVKDYQDTAEEIGETAGSLLGVLNSVLDTLNGLLEKLQSLTDLIKGTE